MTLIEQIVEVMADHRGAAHVDDIAAMLLARYPNLPVRADVNADVSLTRFAPGSPK